MFYKIRVIFSRKQKIKFLTLTCILFIGSLLEFMGVSLILPFVQLVMEPEGAYGEGLELIGTTFGVSSRRELLFVTGLLLMAVYLVKNIYLLFMKYLQFRFIFNNRLELSGRLMESYMKKPYTFHLQKNSSEVLRSVTADVNNLYELLMDGIDLFSNLMMIGMLIVFLVCMDPLITLVVVFLLGMCSFVYFSFMRGRTQTYGRQNQTYNGKMIQAVNQAMGGIKEIKVLARESYFVQAYVENGKRYASSLKRSQIFQQAPKYLIETVCVCGVLGMVLFQLYAGVRIEELIPKLSVFAVAAFRLLPSMNQVNQLLSRILFQKISIDRIYEDLLEAQEGAAIKSEKELSKADTICFEHVSFRYPGSSQMVLKDVNLTLPVHASIGFIGSSGAGKTTFVDLLLGLLQPDSGRICYGEQDIRDYQTEWRRQIGYIPQTIYLADDTIRRNIAFGIPDSQIEEEQVKRALKEAQLLAFVEQLEDGLDTRIGELGVRLSGGQRQRIGIARALYQRPRILVLDEATSALDTETEQAVMEAVEALRGKCMLLMIAHRTSTLKGCDRVYRMEGGKVV